MSGEWKMRREDVIRLISQYRKHKCLWDFRSNEYKRYDMKKHAWMLLAKKFGKEVHDVKKKIKHLRSAYVAEKKKVSESYGTTLVYRPNLFYYEDLDFLDSIIVCRKTATFHNFERTVVDPIEHLDEHTVVTTFNNEFEGIEDTTLPSSARSQPSPVSQPSPSPQPSPPPPAVHTSPPRRPSESQQKTIKKEHKLTPYYTKLNDVVETLTEVTNSVAEESIYDAFGKTISLQLSQLPPLEATSTMSEIHQILSKNIIQSMLSKNRRLSYNSSRATKASFQNDIRGNNRSTEFGGSSMEI